MNYEAERMVDQIVSGISRRKEPYGAICAGIDQKVCFITRGKSLEIIKLWIVSDGEFWDEKSFSGYLFSMMIAVILGIVSRCLMREMIVHF